MRVACSSVLDPPGRALIVAALTTAASAGCFSDRGLAIEIDVGTTGATSVELFLGKTSCDGGDAPPGVDCKAIAPPPTGAVPLRGDIWFRDDLALDTAQVTGHTATFQLRSDTAATIPVVIAVGLTDTNGPGVAAAVLHDVTVPINSARLVTAALGAAGPVQPGTAPTNATEDRVMRWGKMTPPSACVVVEHWDSGTATRTFVVPREDPDCDDVMPECNPQAWHGMAAAGTAARPDCLTHEASGACVLGSRACTDGNPARTGVCAPQHDRVCLPDVLCPCMDIDQTCLAAPLKTAPAMLPHIDCALPVQAGMVCPGKDTGAIEIDGHFAAGKTCDQPVISSLSLAGFGTTGSFGNAVVGLESPQQPCRFHLRWKSGSHLPDTIDYGAIRIGGPNGDVVIPLVLRFVATSVDGCATAQLTCTLNDVATDSMWSCAK